jgi:hypothetical protein
MRAARYEIQAFWSELGDFVVHDLPLGLRMAFRQCPEQPSIV